MRYIALFRGINVSGQKKIIMSDLKAMFEKLCFDNVVTYIQSGNVLFDSDTTDTAQLSTLLENSVKERYGFDVEINVITEDDLKLIIENTPFKEASFEENGTKVLITFLKATPSKDNVEKPLNYVKEPEKLSIDKNTVYLYCPNGYGKSKLSNTFLEKKLGVSATTRNFKTVKKLYELSKEKGK